MSRGGSFRAGGASVRRQLTKSQSKASVLGSIGGASGGAASRSAGARSVSGCRLVLVIESFRGCVEALGFQLVVIGPDNFRPAGTLTRGAVVAGKRTAVTV